MFYYTTCTVTHCNNQHPLLDGEAVDLGVPFYVLDNRITSSSSIPNHSPSEARMSGNGWCAQSMCTVGSESQYLQVDFGAEVLVEAIGIDSVDGNLNVTKYYVEYGLNVNQLYYVISEEFNETKYFTLVCSYMYG